MYISRPSEYNSTTALDTCLYYFSSSQSKSSFICVCEYVRMSVCLYGGLVSYSYVGRSSKKEEEEEKELKRDQICVCVWRCAFLPSNLAIAAAVLARLAILYSSAYVASLASSSLLLAASFGIYYTSSSASLARPSWFRLNPFWQQQNHAAAAPPIFLPSSWSPSSSKSL